MRRGGRGGGRRRCCVHPVRRPRGGAVRRGRRGGRRGRREVRPGGVLAHVGARRGGARGVVVVRPDERGGGHRGRGGRVVPVVHLVDRRLQPHARPHAVADPDAHAQPGASAMPHADAGAQAMPEAHADAEAVAGVYAVGDAESPAAAHVAEVAEAAEALAGGRDGRVVGGGEGEGGGGQVAHQHRHRRSADGYLWGREGERNEKDVAGVFPLIFDQKKKMITPQKLLRMQRLGASYYSTSVHLPS